MVKTWYMGTHHGPIKYHSYSRFLDFWRQRHHVLTIALGSQWRSPFKTGWAAHRRKVTEHELVQIGCLQIRRKHEMFQFSCIKNVKVDMLENDDQILPERVTTSSRNMVPRRSKTCFTAETPQAPHPQIPTVRWSLWIDLGIQSGLPVSSKASNPVSSCIPFYPEATSSNKHQQKIYRRLIILIYIYIYI